MARATQHVDPDFAIPGPFLVDEHAFAVLHECIRPEAVYLPPIHDQLPRFRPRSPAPIFRIQIAQGSNSSAKRHSLPLRPLEHLHLDRFRTNLQLSLVSPPDRSPILQGRSRGAVRTLPDPYFLSPWLSMVFVTI